MAGQKIDMREILQHRLSSLPLSLAKVNGDMNAACKLDMLDILVDNIEILDLVPSPDPHKKTCLLIDGHSVIQSIGKSHSISTFEDCKSFLQSSHSLH